jgi:hypothetical protein
MISTSSGFVLGFLLATAYGAIFHVVMGGPPRRILLYLMASWIGFALGHLLGDLLDIQVILLGAVHLFSASFGSWIALITSWALSKEHA